MAKKEEKEVIKLVWFSKKKEEKRAERRGQIRVVWMLKASPIYDSNKVNSDICSGNLFDSAMSAMKLTERTITQDHKVYWGIELTSQTLETYWNSLVREKWKFGLYF
jgi:hypothetical protein